MVMDRVSALLLSVLVLGCGYCFDLGHGRQLNLLRMRIPGDPSDCKGFQNSVEIESLARFAVQEHNKKQVFFFGSVLLVLEINCDGDFRRIHRN